MIKLLQKLDSLKENKKELSDELQEVLMKFPDYAELYQEKKEVAEVLRLHKKKFIEIAPELGSLDKKIKDKQVEIKAVKELLNDSITIIDRETKKPLQLTLFN